MPPGLPRFFGGAVGWLGYDVVRTLREAARAPSPTSWACPTLCFAITDTVVVFDNLRGTVKVVAAVDVGARAIPTRAYDDACARIEAVLERLAAAGAAAAPARIRRRATAAPARGAPHAAQSATRPACGAIQEYILAGDAFQVVLSQRFEVPRDGVDPFDVYRALRVINPSPYMFHLEFPEAVVTGASPEVLVRLDGGEVEVRPIAGTRRRGATARGGRRARAASCWPTPRSGPSTSCWSTWGATTSGRVSAPGTVRCTS